MDTLASDDERARRSRVLLFDGSGADASSC
jgi:hypothetical protein